MTLGEALKARRMAEGMSREVLAVRAGVSSATVARIEAGLKPRLDTIEVLAAALGTTAGDLLADGDTPQPAASA